LKNWKLILKEHCKEGELLNILLYTRGYKKENPETHDTLAKIARKKFIDKINFLAVVNDQ